MPLRDGISFEFREDVAGPYIHFRLFDADMAFVDCAVSVDFLLLRAARDGISNQNSGALFILYREEIERLAYVIFNAGDNLPRITASHFCDEA